MVKMDGKSKKEQLFILLAIFVCAFGIMCLTGCGGCLGCLCDACDCECMDCQAPKCSSDKREFSDGVEKINGCLVPGCGGIFTSGAGCNCALWPQACLYVKDELVCIDEDGKENDNKFEFSGCDIQYYSGGCGSCLGCSSCFTTEGKLKSCYCGRADFYKEVEMNGNEYVGCVRFIGDTSRKEAAIECAGCMGCVKCSDFHDFYYELLEFESEADLD